MFVLLGKGNPDTENIRDLNLAMVKHTIFKLLLQPEQPFIVHNLL
jgi:hypothetical protein